LITPGHKQKAHDDDDTKHHWNISIASLNLLTANCAAEGFTVPFCKINKYKKAFK